MEVEKIENNKFYFDKEKKVYLIDDFPNLLVDSHGLRYLKRKDMTMPIESIDEHQISISMDVVNKLEKIKGRQTYIGSYGLKHRVEDYHKYVVKTYEYCANGAFIGAMINGGFDIWHDYSLNTEFNFSKASFNKLKKEIDKTKYPNSY